MFLRLALAMNLAGTGVSDLHDLQLVYLYSHSLGGLSICVSCNTWQFAGRPCKVEPLYVYTQKSDYIQIMHANIDRHSMNLNDIDR